MIYENPDNPLILLILIQTLASLEETPRSDCSHGPNDFIEHLTSHCGLQDLYLPGFAGFFTPDKRPVGAVSKGWITNTNNILPLSNSIACEMCDSSW